MSRYCCFCGLDYPDKDVKLVKINYRKPHLNWLEKVDKWYCGIRGICNNCLKGLSRLCQPKVEIFDEY